MAGNERRRFGVGSRHRCCGRHSTGRAGCDSAHVGGGCLRFLVSGQLFVESLQIGEALGSLPPTFLRPEIQDGTRLDAEPVRLLACGPMTLLLAERTASWCLLDDLETAIALDARASSFQELHGRWPSVRKEALREFVVRLYQRGLVRLNGKPGLNPALLDDGALFRDANLVEILVTQKCNLACLYCLAEAGPDMPHLHPELAFAAVDHAFRLPDSKPLSIQLSGGEPFVNIRLFKTLVEYIERKREETGRDVSICTQSNGTLITDEVAEFVRDHEIGIGISVDGPERLNNRSRPTLGGQDSHHRTLRGIRTLQRHGVKFGTIVVLNRMNVDYPEEIADFFAELGIKATKVNPINMIGDAQVTWDDMSITGDQYFGFLDSWIGHVTEKGLRLHESNLAEYLKYLYRRVHDYRCMRSNCGAGESFFLVDAKGDVYPCAHSAGIPEWRLGSLEHSQDGFVSLGRRHAIIEEFQLRRVERMTSTRHCPWRHFCEGGCAVNAYQKFGTIVGPDTLCGFYERMYPRLLELLATEPERFQQLLDVSFGEGRVAVASLSLEADPAPDLRLPVRDPLYSTHHAPLEATPPEATLETATI